MKKTQPSKLNRRDMLRSFGLIGGSALLAGCNPFASGNPANLPAWRYEHLDPDEIAERVYRIYPDGSCMYGVVAGIIGTLAERVGEPFSWFPVEMMRYGAVGVAGWGSLCGVVNGAAAMIGLFHSEKETARREQLTAELCAWYEAAALPVFTPAAPAWAEHVPAVAGGSLLCHVSSARWCSESGYAANSDERRERCRRLTCDGAAKVVDILNRAAHGAMDFGGVSAEVQACNDCHGPRGLANSMGRMNCSSCHDITDEHP